MDLQLLKDSKGLAQFGALLLLIIAFGIFTSLLGILLAVPFVDGNILVRIEMMEFMQNAGDLSLMKYLQILTQLGFFILPAMVFGFLVNKSMAGFFQMKSWPSWSFIGLGVLIMFLANPFNDWLVYQNNLIRLPDFLSGVEEWMRATEERAAETTNLFLKMDNWSDYLINILMIGVLAAVGEELLMRGVLQPLFIKGTRNIHAGIWITAFLFSFIHFQFYGFFARLFLGAILGYMYLYSQNLWVPIIAHFFNNAAAVTFVFITKTPLYSTNPDMGEIEHTNTLFAVLSFSLVVLGIFILRYYYKKETPDLSL